MVAADTPKKGDTFFYRPLGPIVYRVRVERIHRDGSVGIVSLFRVDPWTGEDRAGYLGFPYRVDPRALRSIATATAFEGR